MGRGPGGRHIISLVPLRGEEGVDASNVPFVSHWFDRPGRKQFHTVLTFRDNVVFGAGQGCKGSASGIDRGEGVVLTLSSPVLLIAAKAPTQLGLFVIFSLPAP